ncbi:DNA-directed RNA polymerase subunit alpha C-terminal domain-containing protein [Comamonas odontotermitis]|uniref:DNA-directed RNA polymerase subunit alpha C-terminal domain-containing protein n=1 Tax=Comamonas odontotermitis TaxID=379895 RepID=UPI00160DE5DA
MAKSFSPQYSPLTNRLTTRALNALARRGIISEEQVAKAYPNDLLKTPGFGLVSLREVETVFFLGSATRHHQSQGEDRQKGLRAQNSDHLRFRSRKKKPQRPMHIRPHKRKKPPKCHSGAVQRRGGFFYLELQAWSPASACNLRSMFT